MAQTPAAVATPTVAPIVMPTLAASVPDSNFPRYDQLKPAVSFWTRVFSQYSELQSVVHSSQYPNKIFTVLDFRGDATTLRSEEHTSELQSLMRISYDVF